MLRGLIALLRIVKEVRRVRQILEIAFQRELSLHSLYSSEYYKNLPSKEVIIPRSPKRDIFGQIEEDTENEYEQEKI